MSYKPLKIGITGGIGAGKSIICRIFSTIGVSVYDADSRAKWLMNNDPELQKKIIEIFGEDAYKDGLLNRAQIAKIAFKAPDLLQKLNNLVHPRVGNDYQQWVQAHAAEAYTLKEAALLLEAGSYKELDKIIVVSAPEKIRTERVLTRDTHRTPEDVQNIMNKQWTEEEKLQYADFVIKNDGTELVIPQVMKIHQQLMKQAGG